MFIIVIGITNCEKVAKDHVEKVHVVFMNHLGRDI